MQGNAKEVTTYKDEAFRCEHHLGYQLSDWWQLQNFFGNQRLSITVVRSHFLFLTFFDFATLLEGGVQF